MRHISSLHVTHIKKSAVVHDAQQRLKNLHCKYSLLYFVMICPI